MSKHRNNSAAGGEPAIVFVRDGLFMYCSRIDIVFRRKKIVE